MHAFRQTNDFFLSHSAMHVSLVCSQRELMQASCSSYNSLTSSKLFKHQVEFVLLFKELHQLQDVASEKEKKHHEPEVTDI